MAIYENPELPVSKPGVSQSQAYDTYEAQRRLTALRTVMERTDFDTMQGDSVLHEVLSVSAPGL